MSDKIVSLSELLEAKAESRGLLHKHSLHLSALASLGIAPKKTEEKMRDRRKSQGGGGRGEHGTWVVGEDLNWGGVGLNFMSRSLIRT